MPEVVSRYRRLAPIAVASLLIASSVVVVGCGDETKQTGTVAPSMTPEEVQQLDASAESYKNYNK